MKKLITLLLILLPFLGQAQELQAKILYVDISYDAGSIFCGPTTVKYDITRSRVIVSSEKFELDLKIIKRRVGEYKSSIGKTKDGNYYLISAIDVNGVVGLLFEPIDKKRNEIPYLPDIAVSSGNLCE